jgi:hypothetical protein
VTPGPDDDALAVVRAADLDEGDTLPRWLVDTLWARSAVGVLGGAPKCCLCRARHKQHHAASRVVPRGVGSFVVTAPIEAWTTRHNQVSSPDRR